jgi:universal stress protein A
MRFRRILVAVDAEPIAATAAEVATDLARSLGADLAFVNVIDSALSYAPESGVSPGELTRLAKEEATRLLSTFSQRAALQPQPLSFTPVGKPAAEITRAAKDWSADVIVIGSHGRAGVARALLGSVAEAVTRHAHCPVLVVRPKA